MCVLNAKKIRLFARSVRTKNLIITLNITISIRENQCHITSILLRFTNLDLKIKNPTPLTLVKPE